MWFVAEKYTLQVNPASRLSINVSDLLINNWLFRICQGVPIKENNSSKIWNKRLVKVFFQMWRCDYSCGKRSDVDALLVNMILHTYRLLSKVNTHTFVLLSLWGRPIKYSFTAANKVCVLTQFQSHHTSNSSHQKETYWLVLFKINKKM